VKRVGLIGGVSPESTEVYVRQFNRAARRRMGGEHSATFIVWHLDYGVMIELYRKRDWARFIDEVVTAGEGLKRAGVKALMIGSNTTHVAAEALAEATGLPVIHLLDALARAMRAANVKRPLLLGTAFTMSGEFYRPALAARYDGGPIVPTVAEQSVIERIILDELCHGAVREDSRRAMLDIVAAHPEADGVILGCTELCLILSQEHSALPVFDTTALHADAGMAFAFGEEP